MRCPLVTVVLIESVDRGCGSPGTDVMSCLRAAEADTLALASNRLLASRTSTLFIFAPILDGNVITERPIEAFKAGHFAHVPVLFGSVFRFWTMKR
jgi:carboxylesterase type B